MNTKPSLTAQANDAQANCTQANCTQNNCTQNNLTQNSLVPANLLPANLSRADDKSKNPVGAAPDGSGTELTNNDRYQWNETVTSANLIEQISQQIGELESTIQDELEIYSSIDEELLDKIPADFKLSVVIPVYNEARTATRVICRVAALPINKEIIVIDDCSSDGTGGELQKLQDIDDIKLLFKDRNEGKGAALRSGFECVTGDIIVIQDADLEYDPRDIPGLLLPILEGRADIVYGSRFIDNPQSQPLSGFHRMGNQLLTLASNLFSGLTLTDMETCYKAFSREALECVELVQNRFGVEPELTAKLARRGFRFCEVPISYEARSYSEGKKIGVKDLVKAIYCIGRYGVSD